MAQISFEGLRELHDCANYLLDHSSLRMLDICNVSKDVLTLRGNESSDVSEKIAAYDRYKNKLKEALKCLKNMKGQVLKDMKRTSLVNISTLFHFLCNLYILENLTTSISLLILF
ncbi:hypothetical protein Bca52824_024973 [Brassica carinata]|uniref:Uncharacterized protein n=1 Tax=Brassica carinata TaxID=52824 RepID=A0A8X7VLF9_BRACI|nr:hypothetical protein Bca52824_024973 [Brassica carinata]